MNRDITVKARQNTLYKDISIQAITKHKGEVKDRFAFDGFTMWPVAELDNR